MSEITRSEFNSLMADVATMQEQSAKFVTYEHFYWIIGVLLTIVICLFGVIYQKQSSTDDKVSSTQQSVSFIQGKLENAEITK